MIHDQLLQIESPTATQKRGGHSRSLGIAFAVLFVIGFLVSGGDTPDYNAPNGEWTKWAGDNQSNNQLVVILSLLAGVAFLFFAAIILSVLRAAEAAVRFLLASMGFAVMLGAAGI